ncbi:MAG: hypothetical protein DWQ01_06020 [Planctomycetota bacterium]|nr:MAG: hypothetical protein DWQ01_06020 [Planctomycetota bacterium]
MLQRLLRFGFFPLLLAACAGAVFPQTAFGQARVLLLTGEDRHHRWQETTPVLQALLEKDPRLQVEVLQDLSRMEEVDFQNYEAVIVHFKNEGPELPGAKAFHRLNQYLEQGGGLVLAHFACGAFQEFRGQWQEMVGRVWFGETPPEGGRQHDPYGPFEVRPRPQAHAIVQSMPAFQTKDELYTCLVGETPVTILAEAVSPLDHRVYPMALVRKYHLGRVFLCTLGHDVAAYQNAGTQELYRRGTAWAAGLPPEGHAVFESESPEDPGRYDVVWTSPSENASGSMPLGNGEIGLNAWVNSEGSLLFYISRTDSWSENGRLLKVGRLKVDCDPPLPVGSRYEQRLDLQTGTMVVTCGTEQQFTRLQLWVDANHPVVQIQIEGEIPRTATATIELWRTEREAYPACEVSDLLEDRSKPNRLHRPVYVEADTLLPPEPGRIGWYHHNARSEGPELTAKLQGLWEFLKHQPDPLLHRTFGAMVTAEQAEALGPSRLRSPNRKQHQIQVVVHTEHPATAEQWLQAVEEISQTVRTRSFADRRNAHEQWWRRFWSRSWLHARGKGKVKIVPENEYPLRLGEDQSGGNRFVGEIGRLHLTTPLTGEQVRALAERRDRRPLPSKGLIFATEQGESGPVAASEDWALGGGFTVEAWIKPGDLPASGGRIVDRITPGGADGFLFDTYPGNSLRFIVGRKILSAPEVLVQGEWAHVAATIDGESGTMVLYHNGEMVQQSSWEELGDAEFLSRAYALQRFVDACAGRGRFPIKFNGSIFTVPHPGKFGDADYRRWGPGYWWQNTRLPYLSMCASGDFEMLKPLFRMYADQLMPLHSYRTKKYTGHGGAFIPECMYFWGPTFTATYGWTPFEKRGDDKLQESGWHKWEWVSGLELLWMMLDYYEHTLDGAFLNQSLLPAAREILTFFDQHYALDVKGKLVMHPSQALETWWDCTNPMPEVAGLRAVTARLLNLEKRLTTTKQREFWRALHSKIPELPLWQENGQTLLAPAEVFQAKRNVENPELYAVFPFRLVSFEKNTRELGIRTLERRWDRGDFGWRQDDLFMTTLGLTDQARTHLLNRARNKHAGSRFPVFWGPNYDWIPDQDHGGVLMRGFQTMMLQTEGRKIHLLPAWPSDWDADFKLHAPYRTTIQGSVRNGKLEALQVTPASRQADLIVHG